jgi:hypothetical protein
MREHDRRACKNPSQGVWFLFVSLFSYHVPIKLTHRLYLVMFDLSSPVKQAPVIFHLRYRVVKITYSNVII